MSKGVYLRRPLKDRLLEKVIVVNDCWLWQGGKNERGYGRVSVGGIMRPAHEICYELFVGPVPNGKLLMHSCDTPSCIFYEHVSPATQLENMQDCVRKGRIASGEKQHLSKLKNAEVEVIRLDRRPSRQIAIDYGVSPSTIERIKRGKTWTRGIIVDEANNYRLGLPNLQDHLRAGKWYQPALLPLPDGG